MFSTFRKESGGLLLVRAECIIRIEDSESSCIVAWDEGGETKTQEIKGTALENLERLQHEELAAIAEAQRIDQRRANNLPILPVARGRP